MLEIFLEIEVICEIQSSYSRTEWAVNRAMCEDLGYSYTAVKGLHGELARP